MISAAALTPAFMGNPRKLAEIPFISRGATIPKAFLRDLIGTILTPFRGGIRRRLLAWGLSLFCLGLTIIVVCVYYYTIGLIKRDAAALQSELAAVTAEQIRTFVRRKIERFSDNAAALSLYPLGSKEQQLLLGLLVKNDSSFTDASIIDPRGMEVVKVSDRKVYFPSDLTDQSRSAKFLAAIKGSSYIGPVYTSSRAQPYITLAIPLWGSAQSVAGVISAEADLSFLWEAIGKIRFGRAGYAYLVDDHGNLIAHRDATLVLKRMNLERLEGVKRFLRNRDRADSSPGEEGTGLVGGSVLATYAPVPELGWGVVLEEPLDAALSHIAVLKRSALGFLVVGLLLGAAIIVWVSQKITDPIQRLRDGVALIGAGNLEHRTHIQTGDEIEELAAEFNKMTDALQTSYNTLEQKVAHRTREIAALYEVTTAVNQSLALEEILNAVIEKIIEIFRFESTRIFLFDDEMTELQLRASYAATPENATGVSRFERGQGVIGRVADTGEPMVFENIHTDPRYAALSASKATSRANLSFFAVFPIKTQSRVLGVILFNGRLPRQLTDDETRLLSAMSEHLAVAVEKARFFRQSEHRAQQLAVLNAIGEALNQSLDLQTVVHQAVEKIVESLSFDASWIHLLDPAGSELGLRAHKGLRGDQAGELVSRNPTGGVIGTIFQTGGRLVFEDLANDQQYLRLSPNKKLLGLGFASAAGFPIKAKDKVIGVLYLANREPRRFSADQLQFIESIAHEIGIASENARLFEQVHRATAELEQTNRELRAANQAKSEFIAAMSHELRTPLNVIMGNAELTGDGFFGDINPEQKKAMTQIRHHAEFLLKLVNDVLALSRLDAKKMSVEPTAVKLADVIAHAQCQIDQLNRRKGLEVVWNVAADLPPTIVTDPTKLDEILQNLIGNAFKFTPRGQIRLSVRNIPERSRVEFSVADTGIGIEPQDMERIFSAFEQIREAHTGDFNGVGLGLNIVKKYLDLMNGDIRVESRPGEGSTFTFTLPHALANA
ncbi:MAG TPA: GAF domain-containing protein [Candidatus Binatia bacterium]|nr:GAF domain-containing protein [Candidatus Binatia bacterium]